VRDKELKCVGGERGWYVCYQRGKVLWMVGS
jgi:hypothetical protein